MSTASSAYQSNLYEALLRRYPGTVQILETPKLFYKGDPLVGDELAHLTPAGGQLLHLKLLELLQTALSRGERAKP